MNHDTLLRKSFQAKAPFLLAIAQIRRGEGLPNLILMLFIFWEKARVKKIAKIKCRGEGNLSNA